VTVTLSPRVGLNRWSAGTDPFTRAQRDGDNATLEAVALIYAQGAVAARPVAGKAGRIFWPTDQLGAAAAVPIGGGPAYDDGTAWRSLTADAVHKAGGDVITASGASVVPLTLRPAASSTVDVLVVQNSAGTPLASAKTDGSLAAKALTLSPTAALNGLTIIGATGAPTLAVLRAGTSQTTNLTEWQDSAAALKAFVTASGDSRFSTLGVNVDPYAPLGNSTVSVAPNNAGSKGLTIRLAAAQTANAVEVQNSTGAIVSRLAPDGTWFSTAHRSSGATVVDDVFYAGHGATPVYLGAVLNVQTVSASHAGLIVKQRVAQTGDAFQQQDSAGGILTRIKADGALQLSQSGVLAPIPGIVNSLQLQGYNNPEAMTLVFGRDSNSGPSLATNDVNKTVDLRPGGRGVARGGTFYVSGTTVVNGSATTALQVSSADGVPQGPVATFGNNGAQVSAGNRASWLRFTGNGTRHMDMLWSPVENTFSVMTTGASALDGWAAVQALSFTSTSMRETKSNVAPVDVAAARTGELAFASRLKAVEPVSYQARGADGPGDATLFSFVVEELADLLPEVVSTRPDGKPTGVNLTSLATLTAAVLGRVVGRVDALEARLKAAGIK
jgi:hypothetical protein